MEKGCIYNSPIGDILILEDESGIREIKIKDDNNIDDLKVSNSDNIKLAIKELEEYFNGIRKEFTFKLSINGTEFQEKVWKELINIPYGETKSYKEIAKLIGNEKASRAVGMANNKNKLLIVIPCHRVVGQNGSLIGYACGLNIKKYLLNLESTN